MTGSSKDAISLICRQSFGSTFIALKLNLRLPFFFSVCMCVCDHIMYSKAKLNITQGEKSNNSLQHKRVRRMSSASNLLTNICAQNKTTAA